MFDKDGLARKIRIWLEEAGIEPLYAVTIFCIFITFSYWKVFEKWDEVEYWRKGLAGSAVFATIVLIIFSVLKLFGVANL